MARTKRPANGKRSFRHLKLTRFLICNYCDSFLFGSTASTSTSSGAKLNKKDVSASDSASSSSSNSQIDAYNLNNLNDTLNNENELNTSEYYGEFRPSLSLRSLTLGVICDAKANDQMNA